MRYVSNSPHFTFYNLNPDDVVVPTAVESHIANATLSLCRSRYARPAYEMGVAVSVR